MSATSWLPVVWKVAAARIRMAALMKKAKKSARVESMVAYLMASRLPASDRPKSRVCTMELCR